MANRLSQLFVRQVISHTWLSFMCVCIIARMYTECAVVNGKYLWVNTPQHNVRINDVCDVYMQLN